MANKSQHWEGEPAQKSMGEGHDQDEKPAPEEWRRYEKDLDTWRRGGAAAGKRRHHRDHDDTFTPFLVVRYAAGDTGARPLPSGTVFWHSPDVWVQGPSDINQPVAGTANDMLARVSNTGSMDATGVQVRYWWANPSLAITEANAHLVGTATTFVPAGSSVVVKCPTPWIPVIENQGHECILAEAYVPFFDPLSVALQPVLDRHAGQKNLHVEALEAGKAFSFGVDAVNLSPVPEELTLEARILSPAELRIGLSSPELGLERLDLSPARDPLLLRLDLVETGVFLTGGSRSFGLRLAALAEQARAGQPSHGRPPGAIVRTARFDGFETRRLVVEGELPPGALSRQVYGIELAQRMAEILVGGYVLYLVVD